MTTMNQHIPSYITSPRVREAISEKWPGYHHDWRAVPLRCAEEDIPELLRIATDLEILPTDDPSDDVWETGVMAWYELGRFGPKKAEEILPPLVELLSHPWGDDYGWDDLRSEELSRIFTHLGSDLPEIFDEVLNDPDSTSRQTGPIIEAYRRIAEAKPDRRDAILDRTTEALKQHAELDETTNAFLVGLLIDLKAVESIDVVREVYRAGNATIDFCGDLEDVEIAFGVRKERSTPKPRYNQHLFPPDFDEVTERHLFLEQNIQQSIVARQEPIRKEKKIGRNDPCPCGSGKKYKKCCLRRD